MATPWNATAKPSGGFAPRTVGAENPVRSDLKEQLVHEYERRDPEGEGPPRRMGRWIAVTLGGASLLAVLVMVYFLGYIGGWMTAGLGVVLLAMLMVAGWSGYVFAATERAREHQHIKAEVVKDIGEIEEEGIAETGQTPRTTL